MRICESFIALLDPLDVAGALVYAGGDFRLSDKGCCAPPKKRGGGGEEARGFSTLRGAP